MSDTTHETMTQRLKRQTAVRPTPVDLVAEEKRRRAARDIAFAGKEHVTYFPRERCAICGAVPWLDADKNVLRREHDPDRHNVGASARRTTSSTGDELTDEQIRRPVKPRRDVDDADD